MRWWNRYNFPYSNFHDLNLDWIIREMNRLIEEWDQLKAEWEQMKIEWTEFKAEMQRLWEDYKALMEAAWEAYKANLNQEWADYKDEMDAAWDAYQADLNSQWLAYQNNLNAAWEAYRTSLNDSWSTYQTNMNAWKDGVDQDIQDKFDEIDEKCRQCKAEVDAAIATLNGLLASVQQQVTDYLNNLNYEPIIRDETNNWLDEHGVTIKTNVITPEEYGAVGDGTTDDYQAFRDALQACVDTGKQLFLMGGKNYLLSQPLSLDSTTGGTVSVIYGNNSRITGDIITSSVFKQTIYNLFCDNLGIMGEADVIGGRYINSINVRGRARITNAEVNGFVRVSHGAEALIDNCDLGTYVQLNGGQLYISNSIIRVSSVSGGAIRVDDVNRNGYAEHVALDNILLYTTATTPPALIVTSPRNDATYKDRIVIGKVQCFSNNISGSGYNNEWTVNNAGNYDIAYTALTQI